MNHWPSLIAIVLIVLSNSGCGSSDSAPGTSRKSKFEPVIGSVDAETQIVNNDINLDFLSADHFACLAINVSSVQDQPGLAEVPWDTAEEQLARVVGEPNGRLEAIDRVWILLDRRGLEFGNPNAPSPMSLVIDYSQAIDAESLEQNNQRRIAEATATSPDSVSGLAPVGSLGLQLSDRRILIASQSIIDSYAPDSASHRSSLAQQVAQLKLTSDIEGTLTLDPIQGLVSNITSFAARLGGEQGSRLQKLPDSFQSANFQISLSEPTAMRVSVQLDDPELATEIAQMINESQSGQGGGSSAAPGMLGGMFGGGMPGGFPMSNDTRKMMLDAKVTEAGKQLSDEITEDQLFSVTTDQSEVNLSLKRPSQLDAFIKAAVVDSKQQFLLMQRISQLQKIADALAAYEEKHGCLPPRGTVIDHPDGLPNQFNWRVGLLEQLDPALYQKFDFGQAWDSEINLAVAKDIPEVFSPTVIDDGIVDDLTVIASINATSDGLYSGEEAPQLESIKDTARYTAVVIETQGPPSGPWHQPESGRATESTAAFGVPYENGVLMIAGDLKLRGIDRESEKVQAVLSIDGGEDVGRNDLVRLPELPE